MGGSSLGGAAAVAQTIRAVGAMVGAEVEAGAGAVAVAAVETSAARWEVGANRHTAGPPPAGH
jgi:hypothetical protein